MFFKLAENRLQDVYSSQVWFAPSRKYKKTNISQHFSQLFLSYEMTNSPACESPNDPCDLDFVSLPPLPSFPISLSVKMFPSNVELNYIFYIL